MTHHHALIKSLIEEIRSLQDRIDELENENAEAWNNVGCIQEQASRAMESARRATLEAEDAARHERYRQDDIRQATRDLERAQDWGDRYGVERATRRLRDLSY